MKAKIKVNYWHSDGFGNVSNESEYLTSFSRIKRDFPKEIVELVHRWLKGENNIEIVLDPYEENYTSVRTTSYGALRVSFVSEYRAGGYDDNPVYRYDSDVYEFRKIS
jgi:hypothetical protein